MTGFDKYLKSLAVHERQKSAHLDPRSTILVNAGIGLNWLGDYLANPKIKFKKVSVPVEKILFTGTEPKWNKILIDRCERSVVKFRTLIEKDERLRKKLTNEASFGKEPILLRGPDEQGMYHVFDGMHRFVGAVLAGKKSIYAYAATNERKHLPVCEAHVVYDLIRGFQRHAKDERGKVELYHALKLLSRTYGNVPDLLKKRFDAKHVADNDVQEIIKRVINESK